MKKTIFALVLGISILTSPIALADIISTGQKSVPVFPQPITGLDDHIGTTLNQSNVFTDVAPDSIYFDALYYLKSEGIVTGYADGSFKPNSTINRAEFTKIIIGAVYPETQDCAATSPEFMFSDVINSAWYADYVCLAFNDKIISGYPDGSFKPAQNINFVEASKIIVNTFKISETVQFADTQYPWFFPYVEDLVKHRAIPTTISKFDQQITRGEMAEIVYRLKTDNKAKPSVGAAIDGTTDFYLLPYGSHY